MITFQKRHQKKNNAWKHLSGRRITMKSEETSVFFRINTRLSYLFPGEVSKGKAKGNRKIYKNKDVKYNIQR